VAGGATRGAACLPLPRPGGGAPTHHQVPVCHLVVVRGVFVCTILVHASVICAGWCTNQQSLFRHPIVLALTVSSVLSHPGLSTCWVIHDPALWGSAACNSLEQSRVQAVLRCAHASAQAATWRSASSSRVPSCLGAGAVLESSGSGVTCH